LFLVTALRLPGRFFAFCICLSFSDVAVAWLRWEFVHYGRFLRAQFAWRCLRLGRHRFLYWGAGSPVLDESRGQLFLIVFNAMFRQSGIVVGLSFASFIAMINGGP